MCFLTESLLLVMTLAKPMIVCLQALVNADFEIMRKVIQVVFWVIIYAAFLYLFIFYFVWLAIYLTCKLKQRF